MNENKTRTQELLNSIDVPDTFERIALKFMFWFLIDGPVYSKSEEKFVIKAAKEFEENFDDVKEVFEILLERGKIRKKEIGEDND